MAINPVTAQLKAGAELASAITATGEAFVWLWVDKLHIAVYCSSAEGQLKRTVLEYVTYEKLETAKAMLIPLAIEAGLKRLAEPQKKGITNG